MSVCFDGHTPAMTPLFTHLTPIVLTHYVDQKGRSIGLSFPCSKCNRVIWEWASRLGEMVSAFEDVACLYGECKHGHGDSDVLASEWPHHSAVRLEYREYVRRLFKKPNLK